MAYLNSPRRPVSRVATFREQKITFFFTVFPLVMGYLWAYDQYFPLELRSFFIGGFIMSFFPAAFGVWCAQRWNRQNHFVSAGRAFSTVAYYYMAALVMQTPWGPKTQLVIYAVLLLVIYSVLLRFVKIAADRRAAFLDATEAMA